jgi:LPS-assembly protein
MVSIVNFRVFVGKFQAFKLASLPFLLAASGSGWAQTAPIAPPIDKNIVDFEADALDYDDRADVVTATGNVKMERDGNRVRADKVVWQRKTGQVIATGNVAVTSPGGDVAYGDSIELTDTLKDGIVQELLIVLANGGRIAARSGTRKDNISVLDSAAYSPCAVTDDVECPKAPSWKLKARKVTYNPEENRIRFKGARLELFGLDLPTLPGFSIPADESGATGILAPDLRYTRTNGLEVALPFYLRIAENRDLTLTPHVYTDVLPALEANYRALTNRGAYQVGGFATYGSRFPAGTAGINSERDFRGYFFANGRFQIDPKISVKASTRLTTDRTFLRRYDISRDDRLRSVLNVERTSKSSYFSVAAFGFQTLRRSDSQGQVPIALPVIDYRKRFADPFVGGRFEVQLNSLAISRTKGQDTQRAFSSVRYDVRRITSLGQEVQLTGFARGDVYNTDEIEKTRTAIYRGRNGFASRFITAGAAEIRWPFIGRLFGGTQRITPRFQIVASPGTKNLSLPNEDARSIDLEDTNLFALNRFPGYDRFEDGTRVVYGADWALDIPNFSLQANIGQSYRLSSKIQLYPDGTGLTNQSSDVVGRTTLKYKRFVSLTSRYRLDKDNLAIRRNELDVTVGSESTYATLGYLRLKRNVDISIEDLRDREEARIGARAQLARYWSIFGSAIVDLTSRRDDPTSLSDGFSPVRTRLGIAYEDDCLKFGFTWRRDFDATGDARRGNSYQLELSFRNLGR